MKIKTILTALLGTKTANEPTGWFNNRLPAKCFELAAIATILSLILTAYATVSASAYTSEIPGQNNPTTAEATPTATEAAQKPAEADTTQQMAIDYIDDKREIDFNKLSDKEYEEISVAITEELNNRVETPLYFLKDGQITYLDNKTGELLTISPSEFIERKAEIAPNAYIPAKKDADGTWMYLDEETKQYVRIEGSAGFDFSSVVDENNMDAGIIKWPKTEKNGEYSTYKGPYPDLTFAQTLLKEPYHESYIPVVLVNNHPTYIPAQSSENGNFLKKEKGIEFLVKKAYGFEKIYVTFSAYIIKLQEEDSPEHDGIGYNHKDDGTKRKIEELLIEDQIYLLGFPKDQINAFTSRNKITIDNIEGTVSAKDSVTALTSDQSKENELIITIADILIRHK